MPLVYVPRLDGWEQPLIWLALSALLVAGLYGYRRQMQHRYTDIDADADGLWPANQTKAQALIGWQHITRWSQKSATSPLVLFDHAGLPLISLSPWLGDFGALCTRLIEQTAQPAALPYVRQFYQPALILGGIGLVSCAAGAATIMSPDLLPLLLFVVIVSALILTVTLIFPYRITIDHQSVTLAYPLRKNLSYPRNDVGCKLVHSPFSGFNLRLFERGTARLLLNQNTASKVTLDSYARFYAALHNSQP